MKTILKYFKRSLGILAEWILILVLTVLVGFGSSSFQTKLVNYVADHFLNDGDFYLKAQLLDIGYDGSVHVEGLQLYLGSFHIDLDKTRIDVQLFDAIDQRFIGDSLYIDGLKMTVLPHEVDESDTSSFEYEQVPYCKFKHVSINNTSLYLAGYNDVDTLLFPYVHANNLIFNDSILTDTLIYNRGKLVFVNPVTPRGDTIVDPTNHLLIPSGVPKFNVASFQVNDLYFNTYTEGKEVPSGLQDIDFALNGWNNTGGADISLEYAALTVQDSIHAKINTEKMLLETDKDLHVSDLVVNTSWVDLEVKEFDVFLKNNEFSYAADVSLVRISPEVQTLLPLDGAVLKPGAPDVRLKLSGGYEKGALDLESFNVSFGKENNVFLMGTIGDLTNLKEIDLSSDKIDVSVASLNRYLATDALHDSPIDLIHADLAAKGKIDNLDVATNLRAKNTQLSVSAQLLNFTQDEGKRANLDLRSPRIDFGELLSDPENDLTLIETQLKSSIEIHDDLFSDRIDLTIVADSLKKGTLTIPDIDVLAHLDKDTTSLIAKSGDDKWHLNAATGNNVFKDKSLVLVGDARLSTFDLAGLSLINGQLDGAFEVDVQTDSFLALDVFLENWKYKTDTGHAYEPVDVDLGYHQDSSSSNVNILSDQLLELSFVFSDSLTSYLSKGALNLDSIPTFALNGKLKLDTVFVEEFTGMKVGGDISKVSVISTGNKLLTDISIDAFSYNDYALDSSIISLRKKEEDYEFALNASKINTPYESVSAFQFNSELNPELTGFSMKLAGALEKMGDDFVVQTDLDRDGKELLLSFYENKPLIFGDRTWVPKEGSKILYDGVQLPTGILSLANKNELISLRADGNNAELIIDSFNVQNVLKEFAEVPFTEATLFTDIKFNENTGELNGDILLDEVGVDSLRVGDVAVNFDANELDQTASLLIDEDFGKVSVKGRDLLGQPKVDAIVDKLNLTHLSKIGVIDTNSLMLSGIVDGHVNGKWKDKLEMDGQLTFENTVIDSKELGVYAGINDQSIKITSEMIDFNNLLVTDRNGDSLEINGGIKISEDLPMDLTIKSDRFKVIDNHKSRKDIKGDVAVSSDLKISGDKHGIDVSGMLKTLDGGKFDYYYESTVALDDNDNVVHFISSDQVSSQQQRKKESKSLPINYNVDVTIGTTDIYVLLSKTSNEYFKMKGVGALSVVGRNGTEPQVFGTVSSMSGHVYYELPVVSTIQLDIVETLLLWNGELGNPTITFSGEELFMITPNEISAQMEEQHVKVPVTVSVMVPEKSLDEFELAFDLRSGNQEIQDLFSSLPQETKTNYALDLLTFGKINRDSDASSNSSSIVDKMNEISRRNLKDADLRFSYDSYASDDLSSHSNVKSFGYSYSKSLLEDKLRITIGGALNWGGNGDQQSNIFGDVSLEYVVRESPDVLISLKKTEAYNGPIDGQTTVSSAGVEFRAKFKNLFRRRKNLSTDEIEPND